MDAVALTARRTLTAGRWTRVAIVLCGVAFALWAEATRLASGWQLNWVVVDIVPGLAFLLAGLVAWLRRPDSRIGPVMVLTGFAWFPGTLNASLDPLIARLGSSFQGYYDGLLAWLVLAYPGGRLVGRSSRLVVGALFAVIVVRTLFRLVTFRISTDYDFTLPGEADRFVTDLTLRDTGDAVFRGVLAALMLVVLVLVVRRAAVESTVSRRIGWPMLFAGFAVAAGVLLKFGSLFLATESIGRFEAWALGDVVTAATGAGVAIAFAVGLVRGRLARQSVADLVVELGESEGRNALRDVVARALRDPTVELLYPADLGNGYVDASGVERELPSPSQADRSVTRIDGDGEAVAILVHDAAIDEQPELLRSVAAAVRLAIENERLAAEVRAQLAEVRESRSRIVAAGEAERRRVERDLHDGAQQRLVTLALRLQLALSSAQPADPELAAALDSAARELEGAIAELRELARGLHPQVLATDGLAPAIEALAERTPLPVEVDVATERCDEAVESAAYFVVAEALTNVVRYASASRATVSIRSDNGLLHVAVADDGVGGAEPSRGSGLRGLDDRVAAVGGRLRVESPPGRGTIVRAEIPCA